MLHEMSEIPAMIGEAMRKAEEQLKLGRRIAAMYYWRKAGRLYGLRVDGSATSKITAPTNDACDR
jgi:hypothetical protein